MEAGRRSGQSGEEIFGRLVAVRRAGLGLSQESLAARIDTSQADVARIEEGQPPSTETLKRLAVALDAGSGTGEPSFWTRVRTLDAERRRLAIAVLIPMLVILGAALSVVVQEFGGAGGGSGGDDGVPSQETSRGVSAAPALPPIAAEGTQTSRKSEKSKKAKRPEKKRVTPAAAVSEPSLARAPSAQKRAPAPTQPASEPAPSSPPPSSSDGGSSEPAPQVQNDPAPQVEHGLGGGDASHGLVPGGG